MALINTTTTGILGTTVYGDGAGALTVQKDGVTQGVYGNIPAFSAYMSGVAQAISTATQTKLQINTEHWDTNNNYDNTTNYRFTPTVAGYYQLNGCFIGPSTATGIVTTSIWKNGVLFKYGSYLNNSTASNQATVSCLVYANGTTDYFELYGYHSMGSTYTTSSGAHTDIYLDGILVKAV
jgi:hypothetical protein